MESIGLRTHRQHRADGLHQPCRPAAGLALPRIFSHRVCLERPPKRRVRARGLQEMAKITKPCRPGPLTGRLSKQALHAHVASMTSGACHTRGNGAGPFRAAAPARRLPSPLRSGRGLGEVSLPVSPAQKPVKVRAADGGKQQPIRLRRDDALEAGGGDRQHQLSSLNDCSY